MIFDFKKGFDDNESLQFNQRAIIAISANIIDENSALHFAYSKAIMDAGGVPLIVPANSDAQSTISLIRGVDGILFSGGADIDARYFGEDNIPELTEVSCERDYSEFMLLRAAIDAGVPILGICRGCQLINVALGGSIYQDIPSMYPQKPLPHSILTNKHLPVHDIEISEGSMLHSIIGKSMIGVNSRHHQSLKEVAPALKVVARSLDGVIEAVEAYPVHKIIALQSHPENLATTGESEEMKKLFSFFISEANLYRRAKNIHLLNPIIDSHCDTPMLYDQGGFDFAIRNSVAQVDLAKMKEGYLDATITVAYIPQQTPPNQATDKAFDTLKRFRQDMAKIDNQIVVARSIEDVLNAKSIGIKSVMLGVENGLAIGDEISNIDIFKEEGVAYITLCHNGANAICDSATGDSIHDGVSMFGAEVIERMNKLGVTIDISHSSEKSTFDALNLSSQPLIASHSSCKSLFNHPRNLSDSAIKAIADKGGVVQVCGYGGFLKQDESATILDLVEHIEHVINLTNYDSVGVGSDFDGGAKIEGFIGANNFINITVELLRRGHSEHNIAKIMGGNILRVLSSNQKI
ncbi:MAG: gamma-glutamyl-gamma-aminobutyrate hydrolase family protein [Rikenellaceae bacterium]